MPKKLSILIYIFTISFSVCAQDMEFGAGLGISTFKGDVSPFFNPKQLGVGAQGLFRYKLSRSVTTRANLLYTTYNASDFKTKDPYHNQIRFAVIEGTAFEASAIAEYIFFNQHSQVKKRDFTPYLFAGLGYSFVNNKSNTFSNETFRTLLVPYGLGAKYRIKGPWSIGAEFGSRFTLSDNFDKIFNQYLGDNNDTATEKNQFGDLTRKDQYFFTSLNITYTIFKLQCPE